jgi:RHS repeat-associated protein
MPSASEFQQIANTTRRGFGGHEMLDNVGLVHMNGRVYEPAMGRMLSADPFVVPMLGSQGFNRYAYVGNAPLTYADPSGFSPVDPDDWYDDSDDGGDFDICLWCGANPGIYLGDRGSAARYLGPCAGWCALDGDPTNNPKNGGIEKPERLAASRTGDHINVSTIGGAVLEAAQTAGTQGGIATSPELRETIAIQAAKWLRSKGLIDFDISYDDRYVRIVRTVTGDRTADCGDDPRCGGLGGTGGVTVGGQVTIYRGGVEAIHWPEVIYSDPAKLDPSGGIWGQVWRPQFQSDFEAAIFVIGHESWHVANPGKSGGRPENQHYEWQANWQGYLLLMRYRQQLRRGR